MAAIGIQTPITSQTCLPLGHAVPSNYFIICKNWFPKLVEEKTKNTRLHRIFTLVPSLMFSWSYWKIILFSHNLNWFIYLHDIKLSYFLLFQVSPATTSDLAPVSGVLDVSNIPLPRELTAVTTSTAPSSLQSGHISKYMVHTFYLLQVHLWSTWTIE